METFTATTEELESILEQLRNDRDNIDRQAQAVENEIRRRAIEESWDDGWA